MRYRGGLEHDRMHSLKRALIPFKKREKEDERWQTSAKELGEWYVKVEGGMGCFTAEWNRLEQPASAKRRLEGAESEATNQPKKGGGDRGPTET